MKKFRLILILALISIEAFNVNAENESSNGSDVPIILVPVPKPNRKNIPSKQFIMAVKVGESLYINFKLEEGWCSLIMEDKNLHVETFTFDSSDMNVEIPLNNINGIFSVNLTTEKGNIYTGILK